MAARRPRGSASLSVRKDTAGNETWYAQTRVGPDRRIVKKSLGRKRPPGGRTGMTRTDAERELRAWLGQVAANTASSARQDVTLRHAGEEMLTRLAANGREDATIEGYRTVLHVHAYTYFGEDKPLTAITRRDVEGFLTWMRDGGATGKARAVKTTLNALKVLHGLFTYAERQEWVTANPCRTVERPRDTPKAGGLLFLTMEEVAAAMRAVPKDEWGVVEPTLYLTAAMTGLRLGELVALRWRDVDFTARLVRVSRSRKRTTFGAPKSVAGVRSVPLVGEVARSLDQLSRREHFTGDDDLVFTLYGGPLDRSKITRRWQAALKRGGVRKVRFHDLRHTFASHMAKEGRSLSDLQSLLGHADPKVTEIYRHYMPSTQDVEWAERAFASFSPVATEAASAA